MKPELIRSFRSPVSRRPDFEHFADEPFDDALARMRAWTSPSERHFNNWYARNVYSGRGALVDLGSAYGGTIAPVVAGMLENPRVQPRKAHAYDLFEHALFADQRWPDAKVGAPSLEVFLDAVRPWLRYIEVHHGDVTELGWSGEPIEWLFVDVMKSLEVGRCVLRDFFPHLIPGTAYVVHQDFKHHYTVWVHVMMFRLRRWFRPEFDVPESGSVVFSVRSALPPSEVDPATDHATLELDEVDEVFDWCEGLVEGIGRLKVRTARAMCLLNLHNGMAGTTRLDGSTVDRDAALARAVRVRDALPEGFRTDRNFIEIDQRVNDALERRTTRA